LREYFRYIRLVPKKRESCAWSLDLSAAEEDRLTPQGREGLQYLQQLALDAEERRKDALELRVGRPPMRLEDLEPPDSVDWPHSESTIRQRMRQTKVDVFGRAIGVSAINARRRQKRKIAERPVRICADPDCSNLIPRAAHAKRKYCRGCSSKSSSAARVRAFRTRKRQ
jgi:hypothetical protein